MKSYERSYFIAIILSAVLSACVPPITQTPTHGTPHATPTELPTETNVPATVTVTASATIMPSATILPYEPPTATVAPLPPTPTLDPTEILRNPSFEGDCEHHTFGEVCVSPQWRPFYSSKPYHPEGLTTNGYEHRRPEFRSEGRDIVGPARVKDGNLSQMLFCFFGVCEAGVQQTVSTIPGVYYELSAWVQFWSEDGYNPDGEDSDAYGLLEMFPDKYGEQYTSDQYIGNDDRVNAMAWLAVDVRGVTYAFSDMLVPTIEHRQYSGWAEGCYDQFCKISMYFVSNSYETTVFIGARFKWPFAHNNFYIDAASVRALDFATPTPIVAP